MKRIFITLLIFFFLPGLSNAQKVHEMEEIVVTATRSPRSAEKVVADVDVVKEEDIKNSSATNIDDILRKLGGVDIRRYTDVGFGPPISVYIRGIGGSKKVMLMMDGVPLNSPITGFLNFNQFQLSSIERVEVVKGPFSSLYGSNAMGGVINIISKKREKEGIDIVPMVRLGNFDFKEGGLSILGRKGKFFYSLNGDYRTIDNHYRRDKEVDYIYNPATGGFNKRYKDVSKYSDYNDKRIFARCDYDFSDVTGITFTGNYMKAYTERGTTVFLPVERKRDQDKTSYFLNLSGHTTLFNKLDLEARIFTNYDKSEAKLEHIIDNSAPFGPPFLFVYGDRDYWGRNVGAQIKASIPVKNFSYLTFGIDSNFIKAHWKNTKEDGSVIGDVMDETMNTYAIYLQDEMEFYSRLLITLGARYDINSETEDSFSPKLGILYKLNDNISFRASVGRAFRAPNLQELYSPTWMMIPGIPFKSNPDLDPETVWSYELGTSIKFSDRFKFDLTGFYSKAEDLISAIIKAGIQRFENLNEVETDGFEIAMEGKIFSWLSSYINYTYTHSVEEKRGRLDDMPLHQANSGIRLTHEFGPKKRFTTSLDARYYGSRFFKDRKTQKKIDLDSFTVLDFNMRFELFDRLGIQMAVTNITDEDYEIHGSVLGPERCWWVKVDYKF
ncbi:TonB-dependent receptor plug domain-containing protein [Desulfothermus sp.]